TDKVAAYLRLSLNCVFKPTSPVDFAVVKRHYRNSPLILYRWASCVQDEATLLSLLKSEPRFHESRYLLAAYAHAADAFPERVDWAVEAWGAVPNFTAAGILASEIALHFGEYDRALDTSDRILEIVPTHRRALLSR